MGNGFYAVDSKENLWVGRRLVVRNKETGIQLCTSYLCMSYYLFTGEFYDDFSGVECPKGKQSNITLFSFSLHDYLQDQSESSLAYTQLTWLW